MKFIETTILVLLFLFVSVVCFPVQAEVADRYVAPTEQTTIFHVVLCGVVVGAIIQQNNTWSVLANDDMDRPGFETITKFYKKAIHSKNTRVANIPFTAIAGKQSGIDIECHKDEQRT